MRRFSLGRKHDKSRRRSHVENVIKGEPDSIHLFLQYLRLLFAWVGDTRPPTADDTASYPIEVITRIDTDLEA
jgi:hypothetical protein